MDILSFASKWPEFIGKPAILGLIILIIIKLIAVGVSRRKNPNPENHQAESTSSRTERKGRISKGLLLAILLGIIGLSGLIITEQMPAAPGMSVKMIATQISSLSIIAFCLILPGLILFGKKPETIRRKAGTLLFSHLGVMAGTYLVLFLFLFFVQDTFILNNNFFFQPTSISEEKANSYVQDNVEIIELTTPDDVKLQGWFVKNPAKEKSPLVILFGGSAREVSYLLDYAQKLDGWAVALVNYRGYGLSGGTPSEQAIVNDAMLTYDVFSERQDIDKQKIVAMGWSLGANVAALLSEKREVAATILVAPSDSETHWFQRTCFPYMPLWLFRTQYFDAISAAPSIDSPLLCLIGGKDVNNPPGLARNLVEKWSGEKRVVEYGDEDHSLLFHENNSLEEIETFLKKYE